MNCNDIVNRLAAGEPLDAGEQEHVAGCPACQQLLASLENFEPVDPGRLAAIRNRLAGSTTAVKPLPSDGVLITLLTGLFLIFIALAGFGTHMRALDVLSPFQMALYFGLLLASTVAGSAVVVGEMIPGSILRARGGTWALATGCGLVLVSMVLFRRDSTTNFVHSGLPCFYIGCGCALAAGLLLSLFLRQGFLAFRHSAARMAGFFAALAGVSVLALHCPNLNVSHVVVWHFGILLLGWAAGDLAGRRLESH